MDIILSNRKYWNITFRMSAREFTIFNFIDFTRKTEIRFYPHTRASRSSIWSSKSFFFLYLIIYSYHLI